MRTTARPQVHKLSKMAWYSRCDGCSCIAVTSVTPSGYAYDEGGRYDIHENVHKHGTSSNVIASKLLAAVAIGLALQQRSKVTEVVTYWRVFYVYFCSCWEARRGRRSWSDRLLLPPAALLPYCSQFLGLDRRCSTGFRRRCRVVLFVSLLLTIYRT